MPLSCSAAMTLADANTRNVVTLSRRISPLLVLVGLLAGDRASAVCENFIFNASHSCASAPNCVSVFASASGGGGPMNDSRWTNSLSSINDLLSFTSGAGISEASSSCAVRSEIGDVGVAAIADASGDRALGVSASGTCYAMFRITDLTFSGATPTVATTLNLDLGGTFAVTSSGNADTNAIGSATLTVRGAVCHADESEIFGFKGRRERKAEDIGSNPPTTTDYQNSGVLMNHSLNGPLAIGPFTVPTGEPLQLEVEIVVDAVAIVSKHAADPPLGSASSTNDFLNSVQFPAAGDAFTLPSGYGVTSVQAGIAVPEPGMATMAAASLLSLALLRRR